MNAILLHQLAEHSTWVHSLTELEKLDDLTHWLTTTHPSDVNHALHLLLEKIIGSTEKIELKFK